MGTNNVAHTPSHTAANIVEGIESIAWFINGIDSSIKVLVLVCIATTVSYFKSSIIIVFSIMFRQTSVILLECLNTRIFVLYEIKMVNSGR